MFSSCQMLSDTLKSTVTLTLSAKMTFMSRLLGNILNNAFQQIWFLDGVSSVFYKIVTASFLIRVNILVSIDSVSSDSVEFNRKIELLGQ